MNEQKFVFNGVGELRDFFDKEVVTTTEALEIIGCSRQNLKQLVDRGTLIPIKITPKERLFLKTDITGYKMKRK